MNSQHTQETLTMVRETNTHKKRSPQSEKSTHTRNAHHGQRNADQNQNETPLDIYRDGYYKKTVSRAGKGWKKLEPSVLLVGNLSQCSSHFVSLTDC